MTVGVFGILYPLYPHPFYLPGLGGSRWFVTWIFLGFSYLSMLLERKHGSYMVQGWLSCIPQKRQWAQAKCSVKKELETSRFLNIHV